MNERDQQETAVDRAHRLLIERILTDVYPVGTDLPGERSLSKDLGVARNALREALQRLGHNGWLEISQGRATRVRDFRRDGNLNVLIDLLNIDHSHAHTFVPDLLHMWGLLAHDYTAHAVHNAPNRLLERLELYSSLADSPEACAQAMWQLHRALIDHCDNIAYGLIFNSFASFYQRLAHQYYSLPAKRERARTLWQQLHHAVREKDTELAARLVSSYITTDIPYWKNLPHEHSPENPETTIIVEED